MDELFTETNLKSPNQSGFMPHDLCINQLLSITYEILTMVLRLKVYFYTFRNHLRGHGTWRSCKIKQNVEILQLQAKFQTLWPSGLGICI